MFLEERQMKIEEDRFNREEDRRDRLVRMEEEKCVREEHRKDKLLELECNKNTLLHEKHERDNKLYLKVLGMVSHS